MMLTLKSGNLISLEQICEVKHWTSPSGMTPPPIGIELIYFSGHKTTLIGEEAEQLLKELKAAGHASDVETLRKSAIPTRAKS